MPLIEHTIRDLRFAWRSMRRAPGFAITALLTLTLGIATVSSVFSYYDATYHGVLPYRDVDRLVAFAEVHATSRFAPAYAEVSPEALTLVRGASGSFERLSAYQQDYTVVVFGAEPRGIWTLHVDTAFFPLFGLRAELGRLPSYDELRAGTPVAVISDQLWRAEYGGTDDVLGRAIELHDSAARIVGVLTPEFRFPYQTDIITPLAATALSATSDDPAIDVVGKLRHGVSRSAARTELQVLGQRLARSGDPRFTDASLVLRDEPLDRKAYQFLPRPMVFVGAGMLVLLIACANVANLFYVRTAERRAEMAVRASLGASGGRLLRQALTESVLLSGAATVAGTMLAFAAVKLFLHVVPTSGFPSWFHVGVDVRVLAFAAVTAVLTCIAAGLAPATEATRVDIVRTLKGAGDVGATRRITRRSRRGLVVQLALATALFVAAMLLVGSYAKLRTLDVGYPAAHIALAMPMLQHDRYPDAAAQTGFALDVVDHASHESGIDGAAVLGSGAHPRGIPDSVWERRSGSRRLIPDGDSARSVLDRNAQIAVVSDRYFDILHLRTRAGRVFQPSDDAGAELVAVVSARAAEVLWPRQSPIGRRLQVGRDGQPATVIGVVDDTRDLGMNASREQTSTRRVAVYFSTRQVVSWNPEIIASGAADVGAVRRTLLAALHDVDPTVLVGREATLAVRVESAMFAIRIFGGIIVFLALSALLLSMIGIYGLVAFGVAQRGREFGIRIAVGATTQDVIRLVIQETMRFSAVGLVLGFAIAAWGGRLLRGMLFGVSPLDPTTYALVAIAFGGIALLASYLPARRVGRVDPVAVLRSE